MTMEQIKRDLKEGQQIIEDARKSAGDDKLAQVCYSCQAWGLNRIIDAIDTVRYIKRFLHQKHK